MDVHLNEPFVHLVASWWKKDNATLLFDINSAKSTKLKFWLAQLLKFCMRHTLSLGLAVLLIVALSCANEPEVTVNPITDPPFWGTIFLDPDIVTEKDPSSFESITSQGQDTRVVFDRRVDSWITIEVYLFEVKFDDGLSSEFQVNPEFGDMETAQAIAESYAFAVGQLPTTLRKNVHEVTIHKGNMPFGGGANGLLIHTEMSAEYVSAGILEEALIHEASHTSLDPIHATAAGWIAAQKNDPTFISTYAQEHPTREDVAETFVLYFAVSHRSDRLSAELIQTINKAIPNRLEYLEQQTWELYPQE